MENILVLLVPIYIHLREKSGFCVGGHALIREIIIRCSKKRNFKI
jgi:hypothetical protein